ncbi:MFS transporter [Phytohabitans flavus]|uniref:MFS transporter n=2 Tax=Phytohabitans flavus TaxID=1076124 RepID=A0A6F8XQI6_9ACTN|nr:MFS transporter [Phytohabitans flavus]
MIIGMLNMSRYRAVLALPGVRSLLAVGLLGRLPSACAAIVLTLYVVLDLDRGYAAAGLIGAGVTIGAALGTPLLGRFVDRYGLRPVVAATAVVEAIFWCTAQALPYPALAVAALAGGLLRLPAFPLVRQSIAAIVPPERRRSAYALDSMAVELSFIVGPALAVLLATTAGPRAAMLALAATALASGVAFYLLDPPVRTEAEGVGTDPAVPLRQWLRPRLVGMLAVAAATTLVLGGSDVAVVAAMRDADQVGWTGVVLALWGAYSLAGGFAYGAASRAPGPAALLVLMAACTVPVGLGGGQWWLLALALLPAGVLCAPTLAATADVISRLAPAQVRGVAMGLHGSAVTVGLAVGAPLSGAVMDLRSPPWGFAATGLVGLAVALTVLLGERRRRAAEPPPTGPDNLT